MTSRTGPPDPEHPFFRNLAQRRQRRAQQTAPVVAAESEPQTPRGPRTFRRTAAHYWHHQRKAAREAGNRYPSFVQVPGPWRVAKLGAFARARRTGEPWDITLRGAWFEWLFTRPKVLLTRSGVARLAVEVFSVVLVLGTLWGFLVERERREEERELIAEEREQRRRDRINSAWNLIAAAKQKRTGNIGLVAAIATLRSEGTDNFTGLFLPGAHLRGVQFADARLDGTTMRESNLDSADFSDAELEDADFSGARLRHADLSGAFLWDANLSGAKLGSADLSGACLRRAVLLDANLLGATLTGADLRGAKLSGAKLMSANLSGADLSGADLRGADLLGADLRGAKLSSADLGGANLASSDLRNAKGLEFVEFCGGDSEQGEPVDCANLSGADLAGTPFGIDAPGPDVMPAPDSRR